MRAPARAVKQDWQGLMFDYLRGRATLRRVMLLLDARIEVKEADVAVMELLDRAAVTFQLVLTKADGVKPAALERKLAEAQALARAHPAAHPDVVVTSSETGRGDRGTAGGDRGVGGADRPLPRRSFCPTYRVPLWDTDFHGSHHR